VPLLSLTESRLLFAVLYDRYQSCLLLLRRCGIYLCVRACVRAVSISHGVFARGLQGNASSTKANNLHGPDYGWANACNNALRIVEEAKAEAAAAAPKL
jgi:hypothetical protein